MVHSPMYQRLMRFVEDAKANETLSTTTASTAHPGGHSRGRRASSISEYQGIPGPKTGDAIDKGFRGRNDAGVALEGFGISQRRRSRSRCAAHAREEAEMLSPRPAGRQVDKLRDG